MSHILVKLLSGKGHGHSMWIPEPDESLPAEYRDEGRSIGEVGIRTAEGGFDVLFNACKEVTDPINNNGVPEGFEPILLEPRDISRQTHMHSPGTIIMSGGYRQHSYSIDLSSKASPLIPGGPGIGFNLNFTEEEGAFLYLPEGASSEELLNVTKLRSVAERRARQWYDFARKLGRHGPLFVVTGCDKTHIWGMMAFSGASRSAGLSAMVSVMGVVDGKISWDFTKNDYHCYHYRVGPTPSSALRNQCVFLRGLELRDPGAGIAKLFEKATIRIRGPRDLMRSVPVVPPRTPDSRELKAGHPGPDNLECSSIGRDSDSCNFPQDKSKSIILEGTHYIAIGEHANLLEGKMTDKKVTDKKVAMKVLRGGSSSNPDFLIKFKERLEHEARTWQRLKHPNVSEFYGLAFNFGYMPALILPFYGENTVVEYVKEKDDDARLDMVTQIAQGLEYLHGQSIVHGDLRGSNILVDADEHPRICDYGLAFIIEPSEFTSIKTAGACRWTAPEIMNPPEDASANDSLVLFTTESDIYAFGMTVLEIFTGKIPFHQKKNDSSVIFAVLDGGRPELPLSLKEQEGLEQLVKECWHQEPDKRPMSRAVNQKLHADMPEENATFKGWFGSWF